MAKKDKENNKKGILILLGTTVAVGALALFATGARAQPSKTVRGCTDPKATNYNPNANQDDGSCQYSGPIRGCTDHKALNYNPNATQDDGSCRYPQQTCQPGTKRNIVMCPDGITQKSYEECNAQGTGYTQQSNNCPVQQICTPGDVKNLVACNVCSPPCNPPTGLEQWDECNAQGTAYVTKTIPAWPFCRKQLELRNFEMLTCQNSKQNQILCEWIYYGLVPINSTMTIEALDSNKQVLYRTNIVINLNPTKTTRFASPQFSGAVEEIKFNLNPYVFTTTGMGKQNPGFKTINTC